MKICFLNTLYHPCAIGGAQMSVRQLAEYYSRNGHHVTVIATSESDEWERYKLNGVLVIKVPVANLYNPYSQGVFQVRPSYLRLLWHFKDRFNLEMERRLLKIPEFTGADVLSIHCSASFSVSSWRAAKKSGVPFVTVLRDYYALCQRSAMYRPKSREACDTRCVKCSLSRAPAKELSSEAAAVVGISDFILNKHLNNGYFDGVPSYVVYNGISPIPMPAVPRKGPVRRFAYLGSIIPEKGVDLLVSAFNRIDNPEVTLDIYGRGPDSYVEELKNTSEPGRIRWRGVTPAAEALSSADALVVPSLWDEPFGRVVVEGLSSGCLVIGAQRGGITEILEGSSAGRLFDPNSVDSLVDNIRELLALPESSLPKLRKQARARSLEFNTQSCFDGHLEVLKRAVMSNGEAPLVS